MKIVDAGVLPPSFMDFTLPSAFCRRALYCVPQFGHFYCDAAYDIARAPLDLFLLMYLCAGTLTIETRGQADTARAGQVVLLDCRYAHRYFCPDTAEFLWFHFSGSSSVPYAELLYEQGGLVFSGEQTAALRQVFDRILAHAEGAANSEPLISLAVDQILTTLAAPAPQTGVGSPVEPALRLIRNTYADAITLADLAAQCRMSQSHFIRSFQRHMGRTPHEYLLAYRLRQAKRLLLTTGDTIERIAEDCGFNSASHFARAFRASNGVSPTQFRQMQF